MLLALGVAEWALPVSSSMAERAESISIHADRQVFDPHPIPVGHEKAGGQAGVGVVVGQVLHLAPRVPARGRRTDTSWIRVAKLSDLFRPCYTAVAATGKRADCIAARLVLEAVRP